MAIVKPNFNSGDSFPASSNLEFVKAVVSLLYEAGTSKVTVLESSGLPWLSTVRVMKRMGMTKAAESAVPSLQLDNRE